MGVMYARWRAAAAGALAAAIACGALAADARASGQAAMKPDEAANRLIEKAIAAKGGLRRLQAIRTIHSVATTIYRTMQGEVPFPTSTWIEYPDRYRIDAQMPAGQLVQVYASGHYWIQDPNGVHEAPAAGPIRENLQRDTIPLLIKIASGALVVRGVDTDDQTLGGVEITGEGVTPLTMFINRDNGLIAGVRYGSRSEPGTTEELYSDYRDVNGVQIAFHTVVHRIGAPPIERDVKTFRINVPVPPGLFVKPS
ncbi:MAG TPA: hypothetical protein VGL62_14625 [Vicinamibacterales bacterium]|jgi:hypothetical protein